MSTMGGLGAALGAAKDISGKAAKAQKLKSVKVKVKFGDKKTPKPDKDA